MKRDHDKKPRPRGVSEPVQVYLAPPEQARLERLTAELALTKSEVLRRGLEALEQQLTVPESHPALQLIGLVNDARPEPAGIDVAREHDRYLAESEVVGWGDGAESANARNRAESDSLSETASGDIGKPRRDA